MRFLEKSGHKIRRIAAAAAGLAFAGIIFTACGTMHKFETTDPSLLISAEDLAEQMGKDGVVIVDMQSEEDYAMGHFEGAVNITSSDIVINVPVPNMLTSKKKIAEVMGKNGISNDSTVLVYDSDKMSAARLLWSLWMYGFDNVRVVNGGIKAIKALELPLTSEFPTVEPAEFTPGEPTGEWLASMKDVRAQVDEPMEGVTLLDVRSDEEYLTEGKIPTAIMRNYTEDFYADGSFKSKGITRVNYVESGVFPEDEIIIYCKSSFRAAASFLALYEAGYRNIKIYDGAYLEWTGNGNNPIDMPAGAALPTKSDAS